jgi:hypothetical protein
MPVFPKTQYLRPTCFLPNPPKPTNTMRDGAEISATTSGTTISRETTLRTPGSIMLTRTSPFPSMQRRIKTQLHPVTPHNNLPHTAYISINYRKLYHPNTRQTPYPITRKNDLVRKKPSSGPEFRGDDAGDGRIYAVRYGKIIGLFSDMNDAAMQCSGFSFPEWKGFDDIESATAYIRESEPYFPTPTDNNVSQYNFAPWYGRKHPRTYNHPPRYYYQPDGSTMPISEYYNRTPIPPPVPQNYIHAYGNLASQTPSLTNTMHAPGIFSPPSTRSRSPSPSCQPNLSTALAQTTAGTSTSCRAPSPPNNTHAAAASRNYVPPPANYFNCKG